MVRQQRSQLHKSLRGLQREGFRRVAVLRSPEEVDGAEVHRAPLWTDRRTDHGPFDIIGDVHGCHAELTELLRELGYQLGGDGVTATPPDGRRAVFVGDYGDRGPDTPGVLKLVMSMADAGTAICLPGNHDIKLVRKLKGRDVQVTHGLGETLEQLEGEPDEFREQARDFLDKLVSHVVLDDGKLVVAHAGMKEAYQGRSSGRVRDFALFGETTGETDEFGLPVRLAWAADYRGKAAVVYGHTPVRDAEWLNDTINIDTGCVFGGRLTALRWPERELVSVPASRTYYEPAKPFLSPDDAAPPADEDRPAFLLDVDDVAGKRIVQTRLARTVTVREENAAAALEIMSRFATDPRWLVYLPPTMAPTATSSRPDLLEHPEEAFAEYRSAGVPLVICEEKHMGSRAVVVVCRDADVARDRFGADGGETGAIYTRTGRPFLNTSADTEAALSRVRDAVESAGLWDELATGWLVLDCELLPWSAKAMELIRRQYASVGAAARAGLSAAVAALDMAAARGLDVTRTARAPTSADRTRRSLRRRLPPLRLASQRPIRSSARTVPRPRRRDGRLHRPRPHVAPRALRPARRGRSRLVSTDRPPHRRRHRCRRSSSWRGVVGGADCNRRRGHGRQADELHRPRAQRPGSAWHQMPRPRVPAHHLRPRVRRPQPDRSAANPQPRTQALAWRSASSDSASRHSNGSFGTSRSTECTSACSACSRWRLSPSIPASDLSLRVRYGSLSERSRRAS